MQLEIKIDDSCIEPTVIILTASMSEEVNQIIQKLSEEVPPLLSGRKEGRIEILEPDELITIYASNHKVLAVTGQGEYLLQRRLYEIEAQLNPHQFIRISNSEIINIKKVKHFDLSFTGTICVMLANGSKTYVSRRNVPKIKKLLGI